MKAFLRSWAVIAVAISSLTAQERPTPFNPDSAAAYLKVLSSDIGARPMGSPNEQKAMNFALEQFRSFGLDEAYVLPFAVAPSTTEMWTNTESGTAVGVLKGSSDRIIVIGGHIDSASPDIPGANDDGSGSAVVIELARVMAQRTWESTIVFCLFGGEESGLKGSYHFAENFEDIDKVVLMLQVDMANGVDWLVPLYDIKDHSAPAWLVEASYEEFNTLGYTGLRYPTHFFTLNAPVGGASSDHQPFLEKNIPAIDFTTDVSDPIHTPQDSWELFKLGGLERSGDLVYRLTERFDKGVPEEKTGSFMSFQLGSSIYLVPNGVLWVLIVVGVGFSVWTLAKLRGGRVEQRKGNWKKIPGLKILLLTAFVMFVGWMSEDVLALISGLRSPWYAEPGYILTYGFLAAMVGFMIAATFSKRLDLSDDEYRYALRALVTLFVYLCLTTLVGVRLASYHAFGMLLVSAAFFTTSGPVSVAFVLLGAYPTGRIVFSEAFDFLARTFALIPEGSTAIFANLFMVLLLTLLAAPYGLALAGVLRSGAKTWPKSPVKADGLPVTITVWSLFVISGVLVLQNPAYTDYRAQQIEVEQEVKIGDDTLSTRITSPEVLKGASIHFAAGDTVVEDRSTSVRLTDLPFNAGMWMQADVRPVVDGTDTTGFLATVATWTRPYTLDVRFSPKNSFKGTGIVDLAAGPYAVRKEKGARSIHFSAFPDSALTIPVTLSLTTPDTVRVSVVATFVQPGVPVEVTKPNSSVATRTTVRFEKMIYVGKVAEKSTE